jgi:phosphoglycolate phosphatase
MGLAAVFFDLDGTLLDTEPGILACLRRTLQRFGLPDRPDGELRRFIGPPLEQAWRELVGATHVEEAVESYRRCYALEGQFKAAPFEGIEAALEGLAQRHTLIVATSKRQVFAEEMLGRFGLAPYFKAVYGVTPPQLSEPKAHLIGRILRAHGLSPRRAVMVGDRQFDVIGARANGMACIGVLWGYGSREELTLHGASLLCERPQELIEAVEGLGRPGSRFWPIDP